MENEKKKTNTLLKSSKKGTQNDQPEPLTGKILDDESFKKMINEFDKKVIPNTSEDDTNDQAIQSRGKEERKDYSKIKEDKKMESDNMSEGQTPPQNLTDEEDQKDETDSIPEAEVIEPGHGYEGGEQLRTQILRRTKTGIQDSTQTNRDTGTDTLLMTNISIEEFLEVLDCSFDNNEEEY